MKNIWLRLLGMGSSDLFWKGDLHGQKPGGIGQYFLFQVITVGYLEGLRGRVGEIRLRNIYFFESELFNRDKVNFANTLSSCVGGIETRLESLIYTT